MLTTDAGQIRPSRFKLSPLRPPPQYRFVGASHSPGPGIDRQVPCETMRAQPAKSDSPLPIGPPPFRLPFLRGPDADADQATAAW